MDSNPVISRHLKESGGFSDKWPPVILAGGLLGIYFVNAEFLARDKDGYKQFQNDSGALIKYAIAQAQKEPSFREVIDILAARVEALLNEHCLFDAMVSGGQTRDWIFSGPVAQKLGVPHLSLYKQDKEHPNHAQVVWKGDALSVNQHAYDLKQMLKNHYLVHIVDLITEGSSIYTAGTPENPVATGWLPMIQSRGGNIDTVLAVVDRLQKGKEKMAKVGLNVESFVFIDEDYLRAHSNNPEEAVRYFQNPEAWSKEYLKANGTKDILGFFAPGGTKISHAVKFMKKFEPFLIEIGRREELDALVLQKYNMPVAEVIGGGAK